MNGQLCFSCRELLRLRGSLREESRESPVTEPVRECEGSPGTRRHDAICGPRFCTRVLLILPDECKWPWLRGPSHRHHCRHLGWGGAEVMNTR